MAEFLQFLNITEREAFWIAVGVPTVFVFWRLLDALAIQYFLTLIEEREALTSGAHAASESTLSEAKKIEAATNHTITMCRTEASIKRADEINAAKEAANKIIHEAEAEVAKSLHETRLKLDAEIKTLHSTIGETAAGLANQLADQLKKGVVSSTSRTVQSILFFVTVSTLLLTNVAAVLAESEEGGHHAGHVPADVSTLIPYAVNFSLYVLLLVVTLRKPLSSFWSNRVTTLEASVSAGQLETAKATETLRAAQIRAASINSEIDRIKNDIGKDAKTEAQEILKSAHERALRIREQGRSLAEGDSNHARASYRQKLSKLVVSKASELLKNDVTAAIDTTIRSGVISQIETNVKEIVH